MGVSALLPLLSIILGPLLPAADREPLPAGAIGRLGTARFRTEQPIADAFYTPDGRTLIGCTDEAVYLWDSESGRLRQKLEIADAPSRPVFRGGPSGRGGAVGQGRFALHPKGCILACDGRSGVQRELQFWDIETGRKVATAEAGGAGRNRGRLEWTPDGTRLVASAPTGSPSGIGGPTILMFDERGKRIPVARQWLADVPNARFQVLDDRRFLVTAPEEKPRAVDMETGRTEAEFDVALSDRSYTLAISPRRDTVAFHCGGAGISLFTAGGKALNDGKLGAAVPPFAATDFRRPNMLFAPDGRRLYVSLGYESANFEGRAYECATGRELFGPDPRGRFARRWAALSPDGRRICAVERGGRMLFQLDAATGAEIAQPPGHDRPPSALWMPDDRTLLARSDYGRAWQAWDTATGRCRAFEPTTTGSPAEGDQSRYNWSGSLPAEIAPDGRTLLDPNAVPGGRAGGVWDASTGRLLKPLVPADPALADAPAFAFQAAGRVLLWEFGEHTTRISRYHFALWNRKADAVEARYHIDVSDGYTLAPAGPYILHYARPAAFAYDEDDTDPDKYTLRLYRAADGKLQRTLNLGSRLAEPLNATPNAELLLFTGRRYDPRGGGIADASAPPQYEIWETASGRRAAAWPAAFTAAPAALAPRGNFAVQALAGRAFGVRDPFLGTGTPLQFDLPARPEGFKFSADGRRLAVVLADTTVAVYDCAGWPEALRKTAAPSTEAEFEALWKAMLGDPDAALPAARRLSLLGNRAVDFLKGKVEPVKGVKAEKIPPLIRSLNSDRFAERERASHELAMIGPGAEDALRAALAGKPNAEVKSRAEKLLDGLAVETLTPEQIRELRAVRALFWIDTDAARAFLKVLAGGDPHAALTKAAGSR